MKYIVWGAGQRGIKTIEIFGKENILFFVDKDKERIGEIINGIEIKDIDCLFDCCEQFLILVTPVESGAQIARYLDVHNKKNYLLLENHPQAIDLNEEARTIEATFDFSMLNGKTAIYGNDWFALKLYDYFKKRGEKIYLFIDEEVDDLLVEIIGKEYDLIYGREGLREVDYVLAPERMQSVLGEKYVDIEDYVERSFRITNSMLLKFHEIHKGKRCFIVATGPSLQISDLQKFKESGEICISMNRIYNLFDKTQWRPDYYVIEDQKMIEDLAEEISGLDLKYKFVNCKPESYWRLKKSNTSIKYNMIMQNCLTDNIAFSKNVEHCVYNGYTVTYVCLQLALYMGFSEIYLVGVDFNYSKDIYAESNHFKGYQKRYKDIRLNPIMPDKMLRAFNKAREVADSMGVKIYNATRGGKLEVFERRNLDEIVKDGDK